MYELDLDQDLYKTKESIKNDINKLSEKYNFEFEGKFKNDLINYIFSISEQYYYSGLQDGIIQGESGEDW